jgi:hypothetical protein
MKVKRAWAFVLGLAIAGPAAALAPVTPELPAGCAERDAPPEKCVIQDGPPHRPIVRKKRPAKKTASKAPAIQKSPAPPKQAPVRN